MNWQTLIDPQVSSRVCLTLLHSVWQVALLALFVRGFDRGFDRLWQSRSAQGSYVVNVLALLLAFIVVPVTYVSIDGTSSVSRAVTSQPVANKSPIAESVVVNESTAADEHHMVTPTELPPLNNDLLRDHAEEGKSTASHSSPVAASESESLTWSTFTPWIVALYILGVAWMLIRLAVSIVKANRLVDDATSVASGPLFDALQSIASKWSMRVTPALAIADQVIMPKVIGIVRPVILFPVSAVSGLSADELRMILTHELAHIRRYDMWVNLIQRLAEAALFFNPAIWYLSRRISTLREYRCDEITCQEIASESSSANPSDPQEQYALALLHVVELLPQHSLDQPTTALAAAGRSPSELRRRVARLFGDPLPEPVRISRGGMLMITTALVLLLAGPLVWNFGSDESDVAAKARVTKQDESHDAHATDDHGETVKPVEGKPIQPKADAVAKPAKVNEEEKKPAQVQPVTISGRIVLEDGSPAKVKGWMRHATEVTKSSQYYGTMGQYADRFSHKIPKGTTWLVHNAPGFAPAWVGPFKLKPGETKNDIKIVLKKGFSKRIKLIDGQGRPVADAAIVGLPVVNGNPRGSNQTAIISGKGEYLLEHVADTPYKFTVTGSGFQALRSEPLEMKRGETLTLTMKRAQPTTGVILNADGTPAAGAKLRAKFELTAKAPSIGFADEGEGYWGEVLATTDDQGRFELSSLNSGSHYLFIVETADKARMIVRDLKAGRRDVKIVVPKRRDLIVTLNGDLANMQQRKGKPFLSVRQVIDFSPKIAKGRGSYADLVGANVEIEPTKTGGVAIFKGLAHDDKPQTPQQQVQVLINNLSKARPRPVYDLNSIGDTRISIDLPKRSPDAGKTSTAATQAKTDTNASEEKVTISGRIVLEDGSPANVKGHLYFDTRHGNARTGAGIDGKHADRFAFTTHAGVTWLSYYAKGFAPAWLGPLRLGPGEKRDDAKIVLKRGFSERVKVSNEKGEPVPGATVIAFPEINGFAEGPIFKHITDSQGEVLLEHLANTRYVLKITKPGYQPLQTAPLRVEEGDVLRPTMIRSRPGTGVVRFADGTPAPGSKLRLVYERQNGKDINYTTSADGGLGKIFATTDDEGRFKLNQLADDSRYLFIVEAVDGARVFVHDLQAGQKDVQIVLPRRRDLFIKINGDFRQFPKHRGKRVAFIKQRVEFDSSPKTSYVTWVRAEALIEPTENGGQAIFRGLVVDLNPKAEKQQVKVRLGYFPNHEKRADLNLTGGTRVEFDLAEDASTVKKESKTIKELEPEKKPFITNGRLEYPNSNVKRKAETKAETKKGAVHVHVTVEDGSRATTPVWIWHKTEVDKGFTIVGGGEKFRDQVLFRSPPGKTWIYCFTPGYAPAWDGPFDVEPGVTVWSGDIVLKRGFSAPVKVVNDRGQPIEGATLVANPQFDDVSMTPALPDHQKTTDARGEVLMAHLAELPYTFTVSKPGYQLLRSGAFSMRSGELVTLAMIPGGTGTEPKKEVASFSESKDYFKDAETAPWQVLTLDIHHFLKKLKENQTGKLLSEEEMKSRLTTLLQLWRRLLVMENKYRSYASWLRPDSNTQEYYKGNYAHSILGSSRDHMSFNYWRFVGHQYKEREYLAAAQELLLRINMPEGVDPFLNDLNERGAEFAFAELRQNTATSKKQTSQPLQPPMTQWEFVVMNRNLRGLSYLGRMHYLEERPFRSVKDFLQTKGEKHSIGSFQDVSVTSTQSVQPAGWNVRLTIDGKERWFVVPRSGEVFEQTAKPLVTNEASQPAKSAP